MPIFFFLSGYCTSAQFDKNIPNFFRYFGKKVMHIFIPMLIFEIISQWLLRYPDTNFWTVQTLVNAIIKPKEWFLSTLFYASLVIFGFMILEKIMDGKWFKYVPSLIMIPLGIYLLELSTKHSNAFINALPFNYGILAFALSLMLVGHLIYKIKTFLDINIVDISFQPSLFSRSTNYIHNGITIPFLEGAFVSIIALTPFIIYAINNPIPNMANSNLGSNSIMYCFTALFMINITMFISILICNKTKIIKTIMTFCGKHSLYFYIGHVLVNLSAVLIIQKITGIRYDTSFVNIPWYGAFLLCLFGVLVPTMYIYSKRILVKLFIK